MKYLQEKIPLNDVENGTAALADNPRNEKMAEAYSKIIAQKMSTKEKIMARLKEVSDQNPAEPDMWQKTVEQELKTLIFAGRSRAYFRWERQKGGMDYSRTRLKPNSNTAE